MRTQAAKTVLVFLRYSTKENHRKWIRDSLIGHLCNSKSCYTRHIFINMCIHAINMFSWKYFKEHFYLHLLSLGGKNKKKCQGMYVHQISRHSHINYRLIGNVVSSILKVIFFSR